MIQRTITTPTARVHRSAKHSIMLNPLNITEVDEDENAESIFFQLNVIESQEQGSKSKHEISIDKVKVKFQFLPIINPSKILLV